MGDAATIIPWNMYKIFGDKKILETQYDSMRDWVEYIDSKAGEKPSLQIKDSNMEIGLD